MITDDPVMDYERFAADLADEERKLPKCAYCHEPIQDEYFYCINERNICLECLRDFKIISE